VVCCELCAAVLPRVTDLHLMHRCAASSAPGMSIARTPADALCLYAAGT
jgi:hypothetical protein